MTKLDEKQLFFDRLAEVKKLHKPVLLATLYKEFLGQGISRVTLNTWRKEWEQSNLPVERHSDPEVQEVLDALKASCLKGNAFAGKVWLQVKGQLVDKSEVKVTLELSAEQIARRNLEAERKLGMAGYRVESVQAKPTLLPVNIREDTPPDTGDNPV